MHRSELVTVPSFSPHAAAGSAMCARLTVSLEATFSDTTSSSSRDSASRTASARGSDTAGLVPMTHSALMRPSATASNMSTALRPSPATRFGAFQKRRTRSRSAAEKPMCAASMLASPPTSRPPMALGWPVSDSGPEPGLPMRPVARWQLRMALTLSVPCADWLTPWL